MTPKNSAIFLTLSLALLSACTDGPAKRVNTPTGPLTATAKNRLVKEDPASLKRAAAGFERSGQHSAALNLYLQLSAQYPDDRESALGIARCLINLGQRTEGIARLEALYSADTTDRRARAALIDAYMKDVQIDKARSLLQPVVEGGYASLVEKLQYGVLLEVEGQPEQARLIWDEVRATAPKDPRATRYMAISFALDKEYDTSVALLQSLLDDPETDDMGRETLSYIYALSGQMKAALAIARSALSPREVDARTPLLELLPSLSRKEQATGILLDRVSAATIRRLTQPVNPS